MNFMDAELIHYNDEVSRIPTLCVLLYLYLGMAWGRRKRKLMFFSLKLIPSQPFTSGLFLSPEDIVIAFFLFRDCSRYFSEQTMVDMYRIIWFSRQTHLSEIKRLQHIQGYSFLPFLLLNRSGAFSSVAIVTLYLAASSVVSY